MHCTSGHIPSIDCPVSKSGTSESFSNQEIEKSFPLEALSKASQPDYCFNSQHEEKLCVYKETPMNEECVDILSWLSKAISGDSVGSVEVEDNTSVFDDLIDYVDSIAGESNSLIEGRSFDKYFHVDKETIPLSALKIEGNQDRMEMLRNDSWEDSTQLGNVSRCASPFHPLEIVDFPEMSCYSVDSNSYSFKEEIDEPNWLSDWDSIN